MKLIIVLAVIVYVAANDNHYDTKYDNFDVDAVTSNDRLMFAYVHCLIGDGKCTPEGNDMKKKMSKFCGSGKKNSLPFNLYHDDLVSKQAIDTRRAKPCCKIREWVPESTRSNCAKCTTKQKILAAKFIKAMLTKMPAEWEILSKRYDTEGKGKADLQKFLDENAS